MAIGFLIIGITQTFIGLLSIVYFQKLLDQIPLVSEFSGLLTIFITYAVLSAVNYLLSYLEEYPYRMLDNGIYQWAKVFSMKKIATIDYKSYQNLGTGKLIQLIENGATATKNIVFGFYLKVIREIIPGIIFSLLFIGIYNKTIMLVLLAGYVIIFVISYVLFKFLRERKEEILTHEEDFSRFSVRGFMELLVFRVNKRFKPEIERISKISNDIVRSKAQIRMIHELFFVLFAYIVFFIEIVIIYFQVNQIIAGVSTVGTLVALITFVHKVYQPVAVFNVLLVDYKLNLVTFKRFDKFLSLPDDANLEKTKKLIISKGEVELKKVSFTYDNKQILKNLSLKFKGRKSTALVGTTGGGKSTIVKLVLSLLKPESGKINVDGEDISDVNLESYYGHIAYISQDAPIFDGTIRENLIFDKQVSDQEIFDVLEKVKLRKLVEGLPQKLDTEIGERGIKLSGGEKQRLAFGRMFFQNPDILFLDEPASALDSTTEEFITNNLLELFRDKTLIIIAHRLQTVKNVENILVIENGKVIEEGNFQNLLEKNGKFKELWIKQTQENPAA